MERKHIDQIELARLMGKSRSAVNAWINDRAWPQNRIAALEEVLEISIPRAAEGGPGGNGSSPDPRVALVRQMDWLSKQEQDALIAGIPGRRAG
jgi:hypothetical protein